MLCSQVWGKVRKKWHQVQLKPRTAAKSFARDHRPKVQFQMHSGDFPFCSVNKIEKHK